MKGENYGLELGGFSLNRNYLRKMVVLSVSMSPPNQIERLSEAATVWASRNGLSVGGLSARQDSMCVTSSPEMTPLWDLSMERNSLPKSGGLNEDPLKVKYGGGIEENPFRLFIRILRFITKTNAGFIFTTK